MNILLLWFCGKKIHRLTLTAKSCTAKKKVDIAIAVVYVYIFNIDEKVVVAKIHETSKLV